MIAPTETLDVKTIADEVVASLAGHSQIPTFTSRPGGLTLAQAYRVTPLLRAAFEARGETIIGRKIGFTNREMWKVYGVQSPIWGYVTNRTAHELATAPALRIEDFVAPRIEPEIIFGLRAVPTPGMSEDALLDCIEWVALGYEVVQSIFPDWKFAAADAVAAKWPPWRTLDWSAPCGRTTQDKVAARTGRLSGRTLLRRQIEPNRERRSGAR